MSTEEATQIGRSAAMEIGIASLTDHVRSTADGRTVSAVQRLDQLIDLAVRGEELGLDGFALGEHHSPDFVVSSPAVVLAAIAARTSRIRLGTAVTVLGVLDPVRVFEDFATLDQVSHGRAEVTVGRGAFVEPFQIFGVSTEHYDEIFDEKLGLLLQLSKQEEITWRGRFRSPLDKAEIAPRPEQDALPVWIGVGGTRASAVRAGRLGLPMIIGSLGTPISQVAELAAAYREAGADAGRSDQLRLGVGAHVHVTGTHREAEQMLPYYSDFLGPKRPGRGGLQVTRDFFDAGFDAQSTRYIGTEDEVLEKLAALHETVRFDRFQALVAWGGMPAAMAEDALYRLASVIAPALRRSAPLRDHPFSSSLRRFRRFVVLSAKTAMPPRSASCST